MMGKIIKTLGIGFWFMGIVGIYGSAEWTRMDAVPEALKYFESVIPEIDQRVPRNRHAMEAIREKIGYLLQDIIEDPFGEIPEDILTDLKREIGNLQDNMARDLLVRLQSRADAEGRRLSDLVRRNGMAVVFIAHVTVDIREIQGVKEDLARLPRSTNCALTAAPYLAYLCSRPEAKWTVPEKREIHLSLTPGYGRKYPGEVDLDGFQEVAMNITERMTINEIKIEITPFVSYGSQPDSDPD